LQADGLWEVPNSVGLTRRKGNTDPLKRELVENHIEGGLTEEVFHVLRADPDFVREIAMSLAEAHFPEQSAIIFLQSWDCARDPGIGNGR
jgi:putative restriction endonuclease